MIVRLLSSEDAALRVHGGEQFCCLLPMPHPLHFPVSSPPSLVPASSIYSVLSSALSTELLGLIKSSMQTALGKQARKGDRLGLRRRRRGMMEQAVAWTDDDDDDGRGKDDEDDDEAAAVAARLSTAAASLARVLVLSSFKTLDSISRNT